MKQQVVKSVTCEAVTTLCSGKIGKLVGFTPLAARAGKIDPVSKLSNQLMSTIPSAPQPSESSAGMDIQSMGGALTTIG
jgi:hypothetical protein